MKRLSTLAFILCAQISGAALLAGSSARADEIRNPTAIFAGLDKITGRIISFDVAMDETVQFGTLQITPRVCLTRPQTEAPLTEGFVEVDEIEPAKTSRRVFSGWMFAASPGLHGVEHPVYDVWLKDCKGGVDVIAAPGSAGADVNAPPPPNAAPAPKEPAPAKKPRRTITPQNPVEPRVDALPAEPGPDRPPLAVTPETPPASPANGVGNAGAVDNGLGAPVEVGPPPGAAKPKPKPKPKKPKPKPAPVTNFDGTTPDVPPPDTPPPSSRPRRQQLEPVTPSDLPRDPNLR
jgi:hypothetical protein